MMKVRKQVLGRAGMTHGERRNLERPIPAGTWIVPNDIRLVGDEEPALEWEWLDSPLGELRMLNDDRRVLEDFIDLADDNAPADQFLTFAKRYGPLFLCQHQQPISHSADWVKYFEFNALAEGPNRALLGRDIFIAIPAFRDAMEGSCILVKREPLAGWRHLAKYVKAIVAIATDVHQGGTGREEDWRTIDPTGRIEEHIANRFGPLERVPEARRKITIFVNQLLEMAGVVPFFEWGDDNRAGVSLGGVGVFGAIACQVMLVAGRIKGFSFCAGCGQSIGPRKRRPRKDQNSWCDTCREKGLPMRSARRQYNGRQRAKRGG